MFYLQQIYTFLVESISNYAFKEEKKITQIATRQKQSPRGYSTKQLFFPKCQKLRKIATKKFLFLGKQEWDRRIERKQLNIMPIYHYVQNQGKLMMQSRENGQKPQSGIFFDDFEVKYLQIAIFSEKQVSLKLKVISSTNFRPKSKRNC